MAVVVLITAALVAVCLGLIVGIGIGRELARRRAAESEARAAAERANTVTDELLATVSHELRTPLNAIVGWVHLLKMGSLNRQDATRALDAIDRNAQTETLLVSNLLDEARLRQRPAPLRIASSDLEAIVRRAVGALAGAAQDHDVRIEMAFERSPLPVDVDRARLEQVIWNLVSNAIKFTPMGGRVRVEAASADGEASVRVIDTGEGIDPAFLPHVFEPFRQGETTARRAGVGLGLSIVRQIVELHGGAVVAASAGRGHGASFTVTLPTQVKG